MAGVSKGAGARNVHGQIRVSTAEAEVLAALGHGSKNPVNAGLRRLLDQHMAGKPGTRTAPVPPDPGTGHVSAPPSRGSVTHRHRRSKEPIRVEYDKGQEVKVHVCETCGEELR